MSGRVAEGGAEERAVGTKGRANQQSDRCRDPRGPWFHVVHRSRPFTVQRPLRQVAGLCRRLQRDEVARAAELPGRNLRAVRDTPGAQRLRRRRPRPGLQQHRDLDATELASALLDDETLVRVDLRRNRIGDAGALDLRKVASVNNTLEELLLEGNKGIDRGVTEDIQRALEEKGEGRRRGRESGSSDEGGSGNEYSENEGGSGSEYENDSG